MSVEATAPETWAIIELLGHVRIAGRVTEEDHFGGRVGRIDIPGPDDTWTTQYFTSASLYRATITTEAIARRTALASQPRPVSPWELRDEMPALTDGGGHERHHDDRDDFEENPEDDEENPY